MNKLLHTYNKVRLKELNNIDPSSDYQQLFDTINEQMREIEQSDSYKNLIQKETEMIDELLNNISFVSIEAKLEFLCEYIKQLTPEKELELLILTDYLLQCIFECATVNRDIHLYENTLNEISSYDENQIIKLFFQWINELEIFVKKKDFNKMGAIANDLQILTIYL